MPRAETAGPGRALVASALALLAGCATGLRPPVTTIGTDLDGDTRVDRIATIERGRVTRVAWAPAPGSRPARTVVIAIDAVPYAVFARLQREGLFREFFPGARMVAPFPSLTNVGYTAILEGDGGPHPPGRLQGAALMGAARRRPRLPDRARAPRLAAAQPGRLDARRSAGGTPSTSARPTRRCGRTPPRSCGRPSASGATTA